MALSPEQATAISRSLPTAENQADYLETQIDAWLASEWREPIRTYFHVPTHLKHHPWFNDMMDQVLAKYRPTWPRISAVNFPANDYRDYIVFIP